VQIFHYKRFKTDFRENIPEWNIPEWNFPQSFSRNTYV